MTRQDLIINSKIKPISWSTPEDLQKTGHLLRVFAHKPRGGHSALLEIAA